MNNFPPYKRITQFIFSSIGIFETNSSSDDYSFILLFPWSEKPPNKFIAISLSSLSFSNSSKSSLLPLWLNFKPTIVHLSSFYKSIIMAGPYATTIIISPTFSLGSNLRPFLLMIRFWEYNPGAIFIIPPGSDASIASYIVLYGPDSLSIILFIINFYHL